MRKFICLITALVLCLSLAVPALAAEDTFVPSITYKPYPDIMPVADEDGNPHIGVIYSDDGEIIGYVDHSCLRITPIAHVWDEEIDVPKEIEDLLTYVYDALKSGKMTIPYEKHAADLQAANMVIRDLFDARWVCEEHRLLLEQEGAYLEIIFDLGVVEDAEVFVMTFDEATEEWSPVISTVNNGDGTVTCTFEHLCAIEFSMTIGAASASSASMAGAAEAPGIMPWAIVMVVAMVGVAAIVVTRKKLF